MSQDPDQEDSNIAHLVCGIGFYLFIAFLIGVAMYIFSSVFESNI